MNLQMTIILVLAFIAAEAWVLVYFFIIRQNKIDEMYKKELERIYGK